MTTDNYIQDNKTNTLIKGDKVIMQGCYEAEIDKYKGKTWKCLTDSFLDRGKQEVVFLENFSGYFSTEFLVKVKGDS